MYIIQSLLIKFVEFVEKSVFFGMEFGRRRGLLQRLLESLYLRHSAIFRLVCPFLLFLASVQHRKYLLYFNRVVLVNLLELFAKALYCNFFDLQNSNHDAEGYFRTFVEKHEMRVFIQFI